jgi:hypothetical protein
MSAFFGRLNPKQRMLGAIGGVIVFTLIGLLSYRNSITNVFNFGFLDDGRVLVILNCPSSDGLGRRFAHFFPFEGSIQSISGSIQFISVVVTLGPDDSPDKYKRCSEGECVLSAESTSNTFEEFVLHARIYSELKNQPFAWYCLIEEGGTILRGDNLLDWRIIANTPCGIHRRRWRTGASTSRIAAKAMGGAMGGALGGSMEAVAR